MPMEEATSSIMSNELQDRTQILSEHVEQQRPDGIQAELPMFQHEPLERPTEQIRLLRFTLESTGEDIRCELSTFSKDNAPTYEAISYVCGGPLKDQRVVLNGARCAVTSKCHYALWQVFNISEGGRGQYFWMDCICIDLHNLEEKGSQVQVMWKIYADAQNVLACIGPHNEDSEFVVHTSAAIQIEIPWFPTPDKSKKEQSTALTRAMIRVWKSNTLGQGFNTFSRRLNDGVKAFFGREYWNRLWVIQEISLARRPIVCCGRDTVSLHFLAPLLFCWHETQIPNYFPNFPKRWVGGSFEKAMAPFHPHLSSDALGSDFEAYINCECTDFRDRLYALLHVIKWPDGFDASAITPDYNLSKIGLVMSFTRSLSASKSSGTPPIWFRELIRGLRRSLPLENDDAELRRVIDARVSVDTRAWWQSGVRCVAAWPSEGEELDLEPTSATHEVLRISLKGSQWLFFRRRDAVRPFHNAGWFIFEYGRWIIRHYRTAEHHFIEYVLAAVARDEINGDLVTRTPINMDDVENDG